MHNCGLVLEGGGMKGLYTAGVLEYFLEKGIFFNYVIGVSAGACMGASYLSRQKGRNKKVNIGLVKDPRYLSWRNFILKRELFGMDFLFDKVPNHIVPFDFSALDNSQEDFLVGTMDCQTGEALYYNKKSHGKDILKIIRASSSLPLIAQPVEYNGKVLLDGGLADPLPVKKAYEDGSRKNVVIMTKAVNDCSRPRRTSAFMRLLYRKYPAVADSLEKRVITYNEALAFIEAEQEKDNVYVIRPSVDLPVSSFERNQKRLLRLYELGYQDAHTHSRRLSLWLEKGMA
ncbi:patatin-like phospholipase family protein [Salipaludibacillus aurantiacus]|uniref:Predicted phospholipase, patatin/cPLA2 family n=1 Tax=Salipaludibacillus aurantiacus TaxID=1601833 RepID=A0A1H9VKE8_9BACI|nr:patatin family protein [Salipaludibacillus aurantiacus]SES22018.1 Predicted phospholipase, patatin/cPLA2 family [Salipaludibacillus aurantiacus]